jgi:iron-sulfur cluster assembly protein
MTNPASADTASANTIGLTERAITELKKLDVSRENFLRITVVPGGCSGMTYQVYTDSVQTPFDKLLYEDDAIRVVTDTGSFPRLVGLAIDFSDDLMHAGFKFKNPNAAHSCGCGNSFDA